MVERMLAEMKRQLREGISKTEFDTGDFAPFFEGLETESERALAIVSFSYIDEKLKLLMQLAMNPKVTGGLDSLFENFGPLSTASARIKVAASLYWLSPRTYTDLELLRKIRNAFAHRPFISGFSDKHVSGLVTSLSPVEVVMRAAVPEVFPADGKLPLRIAFHVRAVMTCYQMISEVLCAPQAIRRGLPPLEVLRGGFHELPDSVASLSRTATRLALELVVRGTPGAKRGEPSPLPESEEGQPEGAE